MSNFYQRWCIKHPVKTTFATWIIACAVILPPLVHFIPTTNKTTTVAEPPKCVDSMNIIRAPGLGIDSHHTKAECPKDSVPIVVQYGDPNLIYFSCHCK